MYIVRRNLFAHSAWGTEEEANKQAELLKDKGYTEIDVEFQVVQTDNGHYFV